MSSGRDIAQREAPRARRTRTCAPTIFWGVVLLVFAAVLAVWTLRPTHLDPTLWLLGSVTALGLLLVAGITATFRRTD